MSWIICKLFLIVNYAQRSGRATASLFIYARIFVKIMIISIPILCSLSSFAFLSICLIEPRECNGGIPSIGGCTSNSLVKQELLSEVNRWWAYVLLNSAVVEFTMNPC